MADTIFTNYTPSYTNPLQKITIGDKTYQLKDETLRAIIAGMNKDVVEATLLTSISDVAADANKLATNAAIKNYVDAQVGAINKFDVQIYPTLPTASADTMYILALVADEKAEAGTYIEHITVRSGAEGSYTYKWEAIGSTKTDLADYLTVEATVAGVSFGDDKAITVAELEASDALNLKALSHKDSATGTVEGQTITGVKATGSTTGSITVTVKDAATKTEAAVTRTDLTVSGSIQGGKTTAEGTVALEAGTSTDAGAIQLTGTVSKPDINVSASTDTFKKVVSVGTAASFTEGTFSQGTLPSFTQGAKASWTASVEDEILSFSFSANGDDSWNAGTLPTKAADSFTANTVPTLASEDTSFVTGATATLAATPTFTGNYVKAAFTGSEAEVTGSYSSTLASAGISKVEYLKQEIDDAKFNPAAIELTVGSIAVESKSVTVS